MPFEFSEDQRVRLSTRLMLQPPEAMADVRAYARWKAATRRVHDLPADVLMTLESLVLLAEQGNEVAAELYFDQCADLGITFPRRFNLDA